MIDPVFAIVAAVSIVAGIGVVTRRNPIYSAVCLLACFLAFAVIYLLLDAPFLAAIHVLVYTGAILVLFLFVIMLLNLKPDELGGEAPKSTRVLVGALSAGLFALIAVPMYAATRDLEPAEMTLDHDRAYGTVKGVGLVLFNEYGLAFEMMSVLILVAVMGGVALARRKG